LVNWKNKGEMKKYCWEKTTHPKYEPDPKQFPLHLLRNRNHQCPENPQGAAQTEKRKYDVNSLVSG
jgi:hypothetical protein